MSQTPRSPVAVAVPVLACTTIILDSFPLAWHLKKRNWTAASVVFWVLISNLMTFVNSFIWPTDDISKWWMGYGLCDVEVKVKIAVTFGLIGSLLSIMRNLAHILDTSETVLVPTSMDRFKNRFLTSAYCVAGPVYAMSVHYIFQPSRYAILGISGCYPTMAYTGATIGFLTVWPLVLSLFALYYSILLLHRMYKYRKTLIAVLRVSNSGMTRNRFLRLFWFAFVLIVIVIPVQCYVFAVNVKHPYVKYDWTLVHSDFNNIALVPSGGHVSFDIWIQLAVGIVTFVIFGLGQEAIETYYNWLLGIQFREATGRWYYWLLKLKCKRVKNDVAEYELGQFVRLPDHF